MNFRNILFVFFCMLAASFGYAQTSPNNLHLIDRDSNTGFEIYRYSKPTTEDMKMLCKLGINEVMVLSGTADAHEYKDRQVCPSLKVIYNTRQIPQIPLNSEFLNYFDKWIKEAKAKGKKIAFRCECGCHRTGRLAAYYQMKYQAIPKFDAILTMLNLGKQMYLHPELIPQVSDLFNYIHNLPCKQSIFFCVRR
ncbi:MAG: hypothetical protein U0T83_09120 [Bacteriovoracaceae bacterium]